MAYRGLTRHESAPRPVAQAKRTTKPIAPAVQRSSLSHPMAASVPLGSPQQGPLPRSLKSGIEALSGLAMDDVRVHRGSPKPAAIGALAYAQGRDIHLAPGQDRHLPHEAWHVVQQKQGRVRAAGSLADGIAYNGDPGLEHEADTMGARALSGDQRPADRVGAAAPQTDDVMQCVLDPIEHPTNYHGPLRRQYKDQVTAFLNVLNGRVDEAYNMALRWETLSENTDKMVKLWYEVASAFAEDPDQEPRIINARFGYAIESLACAGLNNSVFRGLTVRTQVGHGHTRPDVVLYAGDEQVAWLDITSVASTGHINRKMHSGWRTRPFIYEVVYPQLNLRELLEGTDDPYFEEYAGMIADEKQQEMVVKERRNDEIAEQITGFRDQNNWDNSGNAGNKRTATMNELRRISRGLGAEVNFTVSTARGTLRELGIAFGPYGFTKGPKGSSNATLNTLVDRSTRDEVNRRQNRVRATRTRRVLQEVREFRPWHELWTELARAYNRDNGNRDVAIAAFKFKGAVRDGERLNGLAEELANTGNGMLRDLRRDITEHMDHAPRDTSVAAIDHWRQEGRTLLERHADIEEAIQLREELETEIHNADGEDRPQLIEWYHSLDFYPPDKGLMRRVRRWLDTDEDERTFEDSEDEMDDGEEMVEDEEAIDSDEEAGDEDEEEEEEEDSI